MRVPDRKKRRTSDEDVLSGCVAAFGCAWLLYAALVISIVVAIAIILWKVALG